MTDIALRRRAFLSICGVLATGGCLGLTESSQARLAWIWLQNDRDNPYEVDVVIEDSGEEIFSGTYEVGTKPETASMRLDNPVEGPGQYVVRATMDGETREVETIDFVEGN